MSTYVFISRSADPLDESGPQITSDEWLSCINSEADFRVPQESESKWLGSHARIWSAYKIPMAFDWRSGQVEVKGPDAATIAKMIQLAHKLRATVFSETGEIFNESGGHGGFLPGFP